MYIVLKKVMIKLTDNIGKSFSLNADLTRQN
ncbi:hypothetical protein ACUXQN_001317 [Staphylococcus cohnii]